MTSHPRFAVVTTKNRHRVLRECIDAIRPQVVRTVIVDNGSDPPIEVSDDYDVITHIEYPPNLSLLWNLGLAHADKLARDAGATEWFTAVLNDDAVVASQWLESIVSAMDHYGAAAGCVSPAVTTPIVQQKAEPVNLLKRMAGYAFVLRGTVELRADEIFRWWYGDDDLDWRARELGGLVVVPGPPVDHRNPNESTRDPRLATQTSIDRATFKRKWGRTPW